MRLIRRFVSAIVTVATFACRLRRYTVEPTHWCRVDEVRIRDESGVPACLRLDVCGLFHGFGAAPGAMISSTRWQT